MPKSSDEYLSTDNCDCPASNLLTTLFRYVSVSHDVTEQSLSDSVLATREPLTTNNATTPTIECVNTLMIVINTLMILICHIMLTNHCHCQVWSHGKHGVYCDSESHAEMRSETVTVTSIPTEDVRECVLRNLLKLLHQHVAKEDSQLQKVFPRNRWNVCGMICSTSILDTSYNLCHYSGVIYWGDLLVFDSQTESTLCMYSQLHTICNYCLRQGGLLSHVSTRQT